MPNYKLPTKVIDGMTSELNNVLARRLEYAMLNPPITVANLQDCAVDRATLAEMQRLEASGVTVGEKSRWSLPVALRKDKLPGLTRDVLIVVNTPEPIHLKFGLHYENRYQHNTGVAAITGRNCK